MKNFSILLILAIGIVICLLYLNNYTYLGLPHIPSNKENIEQKIKNWENNIKNDKDYDNENGFIYNVSLIKDNHNYYLRYIVWQINKKGTKENVIEDLKLTTSFLLSKYERKIIKIQILYNPIGKMDDDEILYNSYVD